MQLVSIRLPKKVLVKLDNRAKKLRCNRSQLVRKILEEALLETPKGRDDKFEQLRTELLMAVGQVGASVKEIPRFIRTATQSKQEEIASSKAAEGASRDVEKRTSIKPAGSPTVSNDVGSNQTRQPTTEKWSYAPGAETAPLRPRLDTIHNPSETTTIEAEIVRTTPESAETIIETVVQDVATAKTNKRAQAADRRAPRSDDQLAGLAIGDERRQSIRLARVLVFKHWDAKMLSQRFKLPLDHIENALAGRGDLASLKVEALLATWEDEMIVSGWSVPTKVSPR